MNALGDDGPYRFGHFRPAAIVVCQSDRDPGVVFGHLYRVGDPLLNAGWKSVKTTDVQKPHAFLMKLMSLRTDHFLEDLDERVDLLGRALPVLGRKREERQVPDAVSGKRLQNPSDVFGAGAMSVRPGKSSLRRPSSVAVHNDRDVGGHCRHGGTFVALIHALSVGSQAH